MVSEKLEISEFFETETAIKFSLVICDYLLRVR